MRAFFRRVYLWLFHRGRRGEGRVCFGRQTEGWVGGWGNFHQKKSRDKTSNAGEQKGNSSREKRGKLVKRGKRWACQNTPLGTSMLSACASPAVVTPSASNSLPSLPPKLRIFSILISLMKSDTDRAGITTCVCGGEDQIWGVRILRIYVTFFTANRSNGEGKIQRKPSHACILLDKGPYCRRGMEQIEKGKESAPTCWFGLNFALPSFARILLCEMPADDVYCSCSHSCSLYPATSCAARARRASEG